MNEDVSVLTSIYVCEWEWDSEAARSKGSELLRQNPKEKANVWSFPVGLISPAGSHIETGVDTYGRLR